MIIHKHRLIFIHNPKVAGESIIQTLGIPKPEVRARDITPKRPKRSRRISNRRGYHILWHEDLSFHKRYMYNKSLYMDYYKFMFVRNPIDRFKSVYKWYSSGGDGTQKDRKIQRSIPSDINDFVNNIKDIQNKFHNRHFHSQVSMLGGCLDDLDFIGRYETIERDWIRVCEHLCLPIEMYKLKKVHVRPSSNFPEHKINISAQSINILRDVYREDFEKFNYE